MASPARYEAALIIFDSREKHTARVKEKSAGRKEGFGTAVFVCDIVSHLGDVENAKGGGLEGSRHRPDRGTDAVGD